MAQDERPVAELLRELSEQTSTLVHQELELAKLELTQKGKRAGIGAGMFGGAGLAGMYAVGALTAAVVLLLATAMAGWLAALVVAAVYGAVAGGLALAGRSQVQQATPPVPEQASESVKEDVRWAKAKAQQARR
ncbi:MAG: phage holin family protein [Solirubrobacteraceae bacterium]